MGGESRHRNIVELWSKVNECHRHLVVHECGGGWVGVHEYGGGWMGVHECGGGWVGVHECGSGWVGVHECGGGWVGVHLSCTSQLNRERSITEI